MNPRPRSITRRDALRRLGLLTGGAVFAPSVLAACGDDGGESTGGTGGGGGSGLYFANWPAYIDEETVALFTEESGIALRYTEEINDNNEYFARILPDLTAGNPIGPDIIAPTYWLVQRLIGLGYAQELPLDDIPNAANLSPSLQNPTWDPDGTFSLPWQSGMTGIAYNVAQTGRDLTSVEDLFDPAFAGKVGMLTEMRDTVGLVMLSTGTDPAEATFESATPAFDRIQEAVSSGHVRQFTGNDYMDDLAAGNFVACVGWSGDIAQLQLDNPDLRFVIPEEGGMQWSDVMMIPVGAANVANAAVWMNYVYDPVNAARIAAYIGYNSPVEGVREVLAASDDEFEVALSESTLMFPDEATLSRLRVFAALDDEEEAAFDARFAEISGAG